MRVGCLAEAIGNIMEGFNVAVVGATDIVGQEVVKVLEQRPLSIRPE